MRQSRKARTFMARASNFFDKRHTLLYVRNMLKFICEYSSDKNKRLISERHISFEEVIAALSTDQFLDVVKNPNKKYPNQEVIVVRINGYVYMVPFVQKDEQAIFLKTIFASRKANKRYAKNEVSNEGSKQN